LSTTLDFRQSHYHRFDLEFGFSCMGYDIAAGWGCAMVQSGPGSLCDLQAALEWATGTDRATVISIATDANSWVPGDADWDVGVREVSARDSVHKARAHQIEIRAKQRVGV
jgi:TPP-dependent trihydroxycyclohexane-1,2-dione (THcHDO) dehydratase